MPGNSFLMENFPSALAAMIGFDVEGKLVGAGLPSCKSCRYGHAGPSNFHAKADKLGCVIRHIEITSPGVFVLRAKDLRLYTSAICELEGATIRLDPIPTHELWREWAKDGFEKCRKQTWDCMLELGRSGKTRTYRYRGRELTDDDDIYGGDELYGFITREKLELQEVLSVPIPETKPVTEEEQLGQLGQRGQADREEVDMDIVDSGTDSLDNDHLDTSLLESTRDMKTQPEAVPLPWDPTPIPIMVSQRTTSSQPLDFRTDTYKPSREARRALIPTTPQSNPASTATSDIRSDAELSISTPRPKDLSLLTKVGDDLETDRITRFRHIVDNALSKTTPTSVASVLSVLGEMCNLAPRVLEAWDKLSAKDLKRSEEMRQLVGERDSLKTQFDVLKSSCTAVQEELSQMRTTRDKSGSFPVDERSTETAKRTFDMLKLVEAENDRLSKNRLSKTIADLRNGLRRAEDDLANAKAISSEWRDRYEASDQARHEVEEALQRIDRYHPPMRNADPDSLHMAKELTDIAQRLKTTEHISDKWKEECERASLDRKHLQTQLNNIEVELERTRRDATSRLAANLDLREGNPALLSERSELQAKLVDTNNGGRKMAEDHSASISQVQSLLHAEGQKIERLQKANRELALKLTNAHGNGFSLIETIRNLQSDNESRTEIDKRAIRYQSERDAARIALKAAEAEFSAIKATLAAVQPELSATKEALEGKEGECSQLGDEAGRLEAELDDLRKTYAVVERLYKTADQNAEEKNKEAEKAMQLVQAAQAEAEQLRAELSIENKQKQALQMARGNLEDTVARLEGELLAAKIEVETLVVSRIVFEKAGLETNEEITPHLTSTVETASNTDTTIVNTAISDTRAISQDTESEAVTSISADLASSETLNNRRDNGTTSSAEVSQLEVMNRRLLRRRKRLESDIARLESVKIAEIETIDAHALLRSYETAWRKSETALAMTRKDNMALEAHLKGTGMSLKRKRKLDAVADMDPDEEIAALRRLVRRLQMQLKPKCENCISLYEPDDDGDLVGFGEANIGEFGVSASSAVP